MNDMEEIKEEPLLNIPETYQRYLEVLYNLSKKNVGVGLRIKILLRHSIFCLPLSLVCFIITCDIAHHIPLHVKQSLEQFLMEVDEIND
ncbi:MAG: hypothetical protein ACFFDF_16745 [Candidatus Odinarchaeota archaeon]